MEKNARVYLKEVKGKKYLYLEVELKNGRVVNLPISQPQKLYNSKLQYLIINNL